ncbi:hypothetical protein [Cyanothece sp. BG0011]|uniref:hypothetical protein n=1 Tax=Cyanothece sp. BG0011 TaxID=2082950 RepID=UPI000D1F1598|nr:hypothetical protein [Cyanothece sp. BG0011]
MTQKNKINFDDFNINNSKIEEIDILTLLYREVKALGEFHECFSIAKQGNSITIYPYGSPLLDEQVINQTLEGLENYPYILDKFKHIIKSYQSAEIEPSPHKYSDVITNLHKVIEMLLKTILENEKSFEKQIKNITQDDKLSDLGKFLKDINISTHIRTMLSEILPKYKDYSNDFKHENPSGNLINKPEVEFMIYLTGTIIRFLTQANKISKEN